MSKALSAILRIRNAVCFAVMMLERTQILSSSTIIRTSVQFGFKIYIPEYFLILLFVTPQNIYSHTVSL